MTAIDVVPAVVLDTAALHGTWVNTNAASQGVARIEIAPDGPALRVSVWGTEPWGSAPADPFTVDGFASRTAMAFSAVFAMAEGEVRLQANIKGGVLVVAMLARGRVNTFSREFFYRTA